LRSGEKEQNSKKGSKVVQKALKIWCQSLNDESGLGDLAEPNNMSQSNSIDFQLVSWQWMLTSLRCLDSLE
jgi:hypothetical protein